MGQRKRNERRGHEQTENEQRHGCVTDGKEKTEEMIRYEGAGGLQRVKVEREDKEEGSMELRTAGTETHPRDPKLISNQETELMDASPDHLRWF